MQRHKTPEVGFTRRLNYQIIVNTRSTLGGRDLRFVPSRIIRIIPVSDLALDVIPCTMELSTAEDEQISAQHELSQALNGASE